MASQLCLNKNTALPENLKRAVLTAKIARRIMSIDRYSEVGDQVLELNKFNQKLKRWGYTKYERKRITEEALLGYMRQVDRCEKTGQPTHRDGSKGIMKRRLKKICDKGSWFRKSNKASNSKTGSRPKGQGRDNNNQDQPISCVIINRTPGES